MEQYINRSKFIWRQKSIDGTEGQPYFVRQDIIRQNLLTGSVGICYDKVVDKVKKDPKFGYECGQTVYFGRTSDPVKTLYRHKNADKNILGFTLGMRLLYYSSIMEEAAEMENNLLSRFPTDERIQKVYSNSHIISGKPISIVKPIYFVYMLRYFIK